VFEEMNALQHFEAFCSLNGPRFYGLPVNEGYVELVREESQVVESIALPATRWCRSLPGKPCAGR
jgi:dihydroorotase